MGEDCPRARSGVTEALLTMARDAAKRFRELVAAGRRFPTRCARPDEARPLPVPAADCAVRAGERAASSASSTLRRGLRRDRRRADAGRPLSRGGRRSRVPPSRAERAELAGTCSSPACGRTPPTSRWTTSACGDAIAEIERNARRAEGEIEVIVPLRGLQMESTRLELATASIVRADAVDVPAEAARGERSGRRRLGAHLPDQRTRVAAAPTRTAARRRRRLRVGGLQRRSSRRCSLLQAGRRRPRPARLDPRRRRSLAPDRHRRRASRARAATGSTETELGDLADFSRADRPDAIRAAGPDGRRHRALRALDRPLRGGPGARRCVDALNDHLLALRFLLEGGGPAGLGLPMRVAALCAEPDERDRRQAVVDRAVGPGARAVERRAGRPRRGRHARRDRAGRRGALPGDPQGRRLRPSRN